VKRNFGICRVSGEIDRKACVMKWRALSNRPIHDLYYTLALYPVSLAEERGQSKPLAFNCGSYVALKNANQSPSREAVQAAAWLLSVVRSAEDAQYSLAA